MKRVGASVDDADTLWCRTANSCYVANVIAPGAYAVVDLQSGPPSIIVQPFGSAGTADPTKKRMTVGMKAYYTTVRMDLANRLVRISSGDAT